MDLLDRFLAHDVWTTRQLLDICSELPDETLDQEFDIGHRTLRKTFDHIIGNMEIWSTLMANECVEAKNDQTLSGMNDRLTAAESRLKTVARKVADSHGWDEEWTDHLDDPPRQKTFGTAIAHVVTHSMHHRAQILYMLRKCGVPSIPEGDVFSWESAVKP